MKLAPFCCPKCQTNWLCCMHCGTDLQETKAGVAYCPEPDCLLSFRSCPHCKTAIQRKPNTFCHKKNCWQAVSEICTDCKKGLCGEHLCAIGLWDWCSMCREKVCDSCAYGNGRADTRCGHCESLLKSGYQ